MAEAEVPAEVQKRIIELVRDLVSGRYALLEHDGRAGRLTGLQLKQELEGYGRSFVPLPPGWKRYAWAFPRQGATGVWSFDVDLWTEEDGRSDLTLQVEATHSRSGTQLRIQNLLVM